MERKITLDFPQSDVYSTGIFMKGIQLGWLGFKCQQKAAFDSFLETYNFGRGPTERLTTDLQRYLTTLGQSVGSGKGWPTNNKLGNIVFPYCDWCVYSLLEMACDPNDFKIVTVEPEKNIVIEANIPDVLEYIFERFYKWITQGRKLDKLQASMSGTGESQELGALGISSFGSVEIGANLKIVGMLVFA